MVKVSPSWVINMSTLKLGWACTSVRGFTVTDALAWIRVVPAASAGAGALFAGLSLASAVALTASSSTRAAAERIRGRQRAAAGIETRFSLTIVGIMEEASSGWG